MMQRFMAILIPRSVRMKEIKGIRVKNLKIEREYFDCELPQEYLEKEPGGPITDEDIKEFFSDEKKSVIESALCEQPEFLDRVKKVLKL